MNLDFDMKPAGVSVSLDSESPWPGLGERGAGGWDPGPLAVLMSGPMWNSTTPGTQVQFGSDLDSQLQLLLP